MHITNAIARKCNYEAIATEKSILQFRIPFVVTFNSKSFNVTTNALLWLTSTWRLLKGQNSIYSCISLDWFMINTLFGKEIVVGLGLGLVPKIGLKGF